MRTRSFIPAMMPLAFALLAACVQHSDDSPASAGSDVTGTTADGLDWGAPRDCTVMAYESVAEPTKFAVDDYVVASSSGKTPTAIPLTKFVVLDSDGKPKEARFAIYLAHAGGHSNLLTPYSPMPLQSQSATSVVLATPPEVSTTDVSTLTIEHARGADVDVTFDETAHGHHARSMTLHCATHAVASAEASAPAADNNASTPTP